MNEQALLIPCAGDHMVGVITRPSPAQAPAPKTAVLVIVGGPQYRAGSHRQFVQLARHLAAAGFPVLRFDVRGMGDSEGAPRSFEGIGDDIAAALQALRREVPTVSRTVLWGLCDGASAALLYLHERHDPLVQGLVLLNPWVRSAESLARTQVKHYYRQRLLQRAFWTKLLSGRVALRALSELLRSVKAAARKPEAATVGFQQRMAQAGSAFTGQMLLVLSGNDYTAKEFLEHACTNRHWTELLQHQKLRQLRLADADHTFSDPEAKSALAVATFMWLSEVFQPDQLAKDIDHA